MKEREEVERWSWRWRRVGGERKTKGCGTKSSWLEVEIARPFESWRRRGRVGGRSRCERKGMEEGRKRGSALKRSKLDAPRRKLEEEKTLTFQTDSSSHQSSSQTLVLHREKKRPSHVDRTRREEEKEVGSFGCKARGSSREARKGPVFVEERETKRLGRR